MEIPLHPDDPRHQRVLREARIQTGLDIPTVLPDDCWRVALVDGVPRLLISPDGIRLIVSRSSNPDPSVAEDLIEQARRRQGLA